MACAQQALEDQIALVGDKPSRHAVMALIVGFSGTFAQKLTDVQDNQAQSWLPASAESTKALAATSPTVVSSQRSPGPALIAVTTLWVGLAARTAWPNPPRTTTTATTSDVTRNAPTMRRPVRVCRNPMTAQAMA